MQADLPVSYDPRHLRHLWEGKAWLILTGLCLTLGIASLLFFPVQPIQQADLHLYDWMQKNRRISPHSDLPVLVGIDEESLAAYGQWPWPRYRIALLIARLQQQGAEVVALDFLMPEPDRTSPEVIRFERQRDKVDPSSPTLAVGQDNNTQRLAAVLGQGKTVLGYYLVFSETNMPAREQAAPKIPDGTILARAFGSTDGWPKPRGTIRSLPQLTASASAEGFTNAIHDFDGVLRRVPLLQLYNANVQPSLALSALLLSASDRALRLDKEGAEVSLRWNDKRIPLDESGSLLVDFRRAVPPFPYISARDVLDDRHAPGDLKGKIVLLGAWAKGLGDSHTTSSGRVLNGLEVHATIIDNIASGTFISRPGWARGAELWAVLLLGTISTLVLSRAGAALSLFTVFAGTAGCFWIGQQLLVSQGLYLSPLLPMLTMTLTALVLSLLKYSIEARKVRQRTRALVEAQDTIITSMSALAEARDKETGGHILRTQRYVEILAKHLSRTPKYAYLDETTIDLLMKSAPLHDIGKVGIPDIILHKPGKLTDDEFAIMKSHTLIGAEALTKVIGGACHPENNDFLTLAKQMIISHHEHWDGTGYPHGLRGEAIPLAGRLMALADVYDALVSRRVYKQGYSHSQAQAFILQNSGTQFDPDVVAAFTERSEDFLKVSQSFSDETAQECGHVQHA